jgi:pyruvate ferredoxin oxidoreductase alpha subunit
MVTTDGFIISHAMETMQILPDAEAKAFIGERKPQYSLLDLKNPIAIGSIDLQNYHFEHKYAVAEAMRNAVKVIKAVGKEFGEKYGRAYDMIEKYRLDDAETAIVCLGSTAGTSKEVVDALRAKGQKVGLVKIRVFRPFPLEDIAAALKNLKAVAVLDRSEPLNAAGGPVFTEICAALFVTENKTKIINYIYGLGGRDVDLHQIESVFARLEKIKGGAAVGNMVEYLGLRK